MLEKKFILGVGITDVTKHEVLEYIIKGLEKNRKNYFVVTPNPEILVLACKAKTYRNILNNAEIALLDGVGIVVAGKILGIRFRERITGVELLENLCRVVAKKPITVGFLGGREGIAERAAECLQNRYSNLKVVFAAEEWSEEGFGFQEKNQESRIRNQESGIRNQKSKIHNSLFPSTSSSLSLGVEDLNSGPKGMLHNSIDLLFVAFGAPKQEMWMSENLDKLPVKVTIGVGGAFDYISGKIPRAPRWVQKIGFEWLFRLLIQPWRIIRQLALLDFVFLVLKERFK